VRLCVEGGSRDDGATAFEVGKRLRLDKSAALRRLRKAQDHDLVVNLEDRRGQPGRYRPAEAVPEAADILPDPSTLVQPAQPYDRTENSQADQSTNGCKNGCALDATDDASNEDQAGCAPGATADATTKLLVQKEKTPPVAGLQRLQGVDEEADFEERAAIKEYDGGLSREEAETEAAAELPHMPTSSRRDQ